MERFKIAYSHSKFWLIFWLLIFFPIGVILIVKHTKLMSRDRLFRVEYEGSYFWLFFWALFFFPVTLLLFLFNGSFVKSTDQLA